ncbi:MAG: PQQ-binding-like beta-propeller repeat protein, partial [Candidatus Heimdallarchaeota archaeon]
NIDEGSGNIIFDQSGNGNDGIIYGANWSSEYPNELSSLLVLSSPDGGESWGTGTTELITWANTNNVENIKIDYSTNNGSTWINIVTSTPSAPGSYPWTIPNTPSSESLVKITDVSNSELYDISQLTFQITGGDLTVLSPNGGETFNVGETEAIQWSSSNISNVKIDYSTDDGSTWLNIVASIPAGSGSYNWLVPNTPSQLCKVKISDAANPSLYDVSNSNFTIVGSTLELTRPNGGENFTIGTNEQILWNSNNVDNIHLEYSTNNGSTWSTIIASTPAGSGSYDWSVPNTPSVNCLVKITDASNPSIFDISDNVFIISDILINVSIVADTIWYDDNFDGLELGQVDGSGSSISQGTIVSYTWTVNGIVLSTDPTPVIELENGTNFVRLTIVGDQGHSNSDSLAISVYAAQLSTGGAIRSGISQIGDIFYATSMDQGVYRFDSTASSLPPFMTGGSIQSTLCISNNNYLYVGSDDTRIYAFDTDLNSIWDKAMGGVIVSSPSVTSDANRLYIGTESGILKAIDANDGSPLWSFAADGSIVSSPSIIELVDSVGNVLETIIYFGSGNGTFYALIDMGGTYSTFWQLETDLDSAIISSPAISNEGIIYFGSTNGYLYRVTWDGIYSTTWKNYTGGRIESSPVIGNDSIVYIASESGYLYGFEKEFLYNSNPVKSFYQDVGINGTPSIGPEGTIYIG